MMAPIREVQATWQALLEAVLRHSAEAPAEELAEGDADTLRQAQNHILIRLHEAKNQMRPASTPGAPSATRTAGR
jgi:hypothetical protein